MRATLLLMFSFAALNAEHTAPPVFKTAVSLPDVKGRIDHFAIDLTGHRIFLSALGNRTVEAIDAQAFRRLRTIAGIAEPQGLLYESHSGRLFVASRGDGAVRIFDGSTFSRISSINLGGDADNVRFDSRNGNIIVGYGSGAFAILGADGTKKADVKLDAHPESFQLERQGSRAFVNIPERLEIEVVNLSTGSVVGRWRKWTSLRNFPMALDEKHHHVFSGFRTPARLLAIDTASGKTVGSTEIVGDTDDLFYDAVRERVYVIGGEGFVDVLDVKDPARMKRLARIEIAPGARTGLFVPEWNQLFVAVPKSGDRAAEVRVFNVPGGM